ncbi:MAG TPA: hypothetical protein VEW91_00565 [bacterium]|nr:hypothetical protein [bacterium]
MSRAFVCAALAALVVGCGGRTPAAHPLSSSPASEASPQAGPRALRIAVVDLARAARVHPRWPEVTVLDRQVSELQAKLALETSGAAGRIEPPKIDLTPEMQAAVERMQPEFQREAEAVKAAARQDMDAYVAQLRVEDQKKAEAKRAELEAELTKAVRDKQQALEADTQQFQQQTMGEYRLPLLNLKLKLETLQPAGKGESDRLTQQIQALTNERDEKIAAHEKANRQALEDFQKERVQASSAELQAYQAQLAKEGQQLVNERAAKVTEQVRAQLTAKQAEFNQRLRGQEQAIVSAARGTQAREAEARYRALVEAETARIRALQEELRGVQLGRARVFAVILADLRVEAAALAQEKGWDVVLTQAIVAPGTVDATDELIARIRR